MSSFSVLWLLAWCWLALVVRGAGVPAFLAWLGFGAAPFAFGLARLAVSRWWGGVVFWRGVGRLGGSWRRSALAWALLRGGFVGCGLLSRSAWWSAWWLVLFGRSLRRW